MKLHNSAIPDSENCSRGDRVIVAARDILLATEALTEMIIIEREANVAKPEEEPAQVPFAR